KLMCTWRQTLQVWPALVVAGGSFALFQFTFATAHAYVPSLVLWPMTDIGGGIFSLVVTAIFLRFWRPKEEWHYGETRNAERGRGDQETRGRSGRGGGGRERRCPIGPRGTRRLGWSSQR